MQMVYANMKTPFILQIIHLQQFMSAFITVERKNMKVDLNMFMYIGQRLQQDSGLKHGWGKKYTLMEKLQEVLSFLRLWFQKFQLENSEM